MLNEIFTVTEPPESKYIYFEECYIRNHHTVTDLEILEHIARIVGKDNITVRLHPKTIVDRFSPNGYKVSPQDGSLWELTCLLADLSNKVFLTVKSSATFSALSISHFPPRVILLKDIVKGCFPNKNAEDFIRYLQAVSEATGGCCSKLFVPQSKEELDIILQEVQRGN